MNQAETTIQPDALDAGSDLDRLVALACNFTLLDSASTWISDHVGVQRTFEPSRRWADAGELVERFGLSLSPAQRRWPEGGWVCFPPSCEVVATATTPLVAVCRCVLELQAKR